MAMTFFKHVTLVKFGAGAVDTLADEMKGLGGTKCLVVSDKGIEHSTQEETAKLYKGRGVRLNGEDRYVLTTRNDGTISFDVGADHCYVSMSKEEY